MHKLTDWMCVFRGPREFKHLNSVRCETLNVIAHPLGSPFFRGTLIIDGQCDSPLRLSRRRGNLSLFLGLV